MKIEVHDCNEEQIKIEDRNKIPRCEDPICDDKCPVGKSAKCEFSSNSENNKKKNKCICLPGYKGDYCGTKDFIDYR